MELNKVYCMDCLEGMKQIDDRSVDMILCDLPFGTTQNKWDIVIPFEPLWGHYERIIKTNGAIVLFSMEPFTSTLITSNPKLFRYDLIWEKSHSVGFLNANRMPMRKHENIVVFYKKLPKYNPQISDKPVENIRPIPTKGRLSSNYGKFDEGNHRKIPKDKTYPNSILKFNNESKTSTFHPTQKPVALFEYLIRTYTDEGELVLDNCMGSFTTAVACIKTRRNYIGFENDPKYFELGNKRLEELKQDEIQSSLL